MRPIAYITLVVAPLIAIALFLYVRKRNGSNFSRLLMISFAAGGTGILVLLAAEALSALIGLDNLASLKRILFYSFITVGGSSELGKFIVLRIFFVRRKEVAKTIDAITFSVMTALGFSFLALLLFALNVYNIRVNFPATLYAFIFVPANILFAVIMGFFAGMAKFLQQSG